MKLIYTADLHGDQYLYDELHRIIYRETNVDAILLGGDLFAHTRKVSDQLRFIDSFFYQFAKAINVDILFIPGNNDWPASIQQLNNLSLSNIILQLQLRAYPYKYTHISGYPMVPPTPFRRKDYEARDMSTDEIQPQEDAYYSSLSGNIEPVEHNYFMDKPSMEEELKQMDPLSNIWICHSPPKGGNLDMGWGHHHLGSQALYNLIRKRQPLLSLHGHIHEAPMLSGNWIEKIGNTFCVNPGRNDQHVHAVIIKLDENGMLYDIQHTEYGHYKL